MEGLQKILNGIVQFKREDFEQHKELFQNLHRKKNLKKIK